MTGLAQAIVEWDRASFLAINHALRCGALDTAMPLVSLLGLGHVQVLLILGAALLAGAVAGEMDWRRTWPSVRGVLVRRRDWVLPLLAAFALSGIVSTQIKESRAIYRERPWWFYTQRQARGQFLDVVVATVPGEYPLKSRGFPSGHTCTTTAIAASASLVLRRRRRGALVIGGLWLVSVLIAWSRMYLGSHWTLDVLGGALIGAVCGLLAAWLAMRWLARAGAQKPSTPEPDLSGVA